MTKIPEDIKEGILKIAKERNIGPEVLVKKMEELIKTYPIIQTLSDPEEKIQVAWGLLAAKFVREGGSSGKKYYVYILSVNGPRKAKENTVTELVGIATDDKNSPIYAKITAWGEMADIAGKLTRGKEYQLEIRGAVTADGLNGTLVDNSEVEISRQQHIEPIKFFETLYETDRRCTIADAELNVVDKKERMNFRILKATVLSSRLGEKDGRKFCTYNIIDHTFTVGDRVAGFSVACNDDQYICGSGSRAYFLGPIIKTIKGNITRLRMINGVICPITLIPLQTESATEAKDEVPIDSEEGLD